MNPLRYIQALFGLGDVDAFWMAREEILKRPGKHCLENYLCKIIRKHYGAGIPILPDINRFATPHGFYGIFISQRANVGEGCVIYQQVTIGSNDLQNSRGGTNHWQQLLNWCRCENYRKCPCRQYCENWSKRNRSG